MNSLHNFNRNSISSLNQGLNHVVVLFHGSKPCYILLEFTLRNLISIFHIEYPGMENSYYKLYNKRSLLSCTFFSMLLILITIALVVSIMQLSYAGGARSDWSDFYDTVEGAPECWQDGYDDGLDHPFDQDRHNECQFNIEEHPDFGEPVL